MTELALSPIMKQGLIVAACAVAWAVMADAACRPRQDGILPRRSLCGNAILICAIVLALGLGMVITGSAITSAVLAAALTAALTLISNIKNKVLGEPLVFSDFALIGAVFQQPQFYVSALRGWQIGVLAGGFAAVLAMLLWFSNAQMAPRLGGLVVAGGAGLLLALLLGLRRWDGLAARPCLYSDVLTHGLIATLLVHWTHWRRQADPPACDAPMIAGHPEQLVIIVQCESFTDPADLWGDQALSLPALSSARAIARQSGRLMAHGFGAYTMRTEYGVMFGRSEADLRLRKFDPFLTAAGEASFSLANRLPSDIWDCHFVHPHDLRFYGRDKLMGKAGFSHLVGQDAFAAPLPGEGRYVSDAAVADKISELAANAASPTLIYAVTIENHGPWPAVKSGGSDDSGEQYLRLLRRSDAMLAQLIEIARAQRRPVILCFFGDHRPSIPSVSEPSDDSGTPYVLIDFGPDGIPQCHGGADRDLVPAQLHHLILEVIESRGGQGQ